MSSELYADKVWFYGSISSDPEIKKLGAVGRIRDLTEQMIQYIGHANLANRAMYARLMRAVETPTESSGSCLGEGKDFALVEQADEHGFIVNGVYKIKKKQVFLDFQDIVDIAISVGMSSRPWAGLRNILFNRNLMDPFVQAHASNYHEFARTGNLYTEFLEDDVAPSVELAFDETRPDEMKLKRAEGHICKIR